MEEVMPELDILYMTRVQRERFFNEEDYVRLKDYLRAHPAEAGFGQGGPGGAAPAAPCERNRPRGGQRPPRHATLSRPGAACSSAWR